MGNKEVERGWIHLVISEVCTYCYIPLAAVQTSGKEPAMKRASLGAILAAGAFVLGVPTGAAFAAHPTAVDPVFTDPVQEAIATTVTALFDEELDTLDATLEDVQSALAAEAEVAAAEAAAQPNNASEASAATTSAAPAADRAEAPNPSSDEPSAPGPAASTISFGGTTLSFVDDYEAASAPSSGAGLWLGSDSTTDGSWGYFIGHNPGPFHGAMNLGSGDAVTVCDRNGASRTYYVCDSFTVPDTTCWEDIASRVCGHGESVALQTCVGDGASYRIVVAA